MAGEWVERCNAGVTSVCALVQKCECAPRAECWNQKGNLADGHGPPHGQGCAVIRRPRGGVRGLPQAPNTHLHTLTLGAVPGVAVVCVAYRG